MLSSISVINMHANYSKVLQLTYSVWQWSKGFKQWMFYQFLLANSEMWIHMVVILPYNLGFGKKQKEIRPGIFTWKFYCVPMRKNYHPNRAYVTFSHFILVYATNLWTTALMENIISGETSIAKVSHKASKNNCSLNIYIYIYIQYIYIWSHKTCRWSIFFIW